MIRLNDVINGRYKILSELGHGGTSDVYEVRDPIFKRIDALKILKFDCAQKIENIVRFQNEARFLAAFNHPNIIAVYDYGEYENLPYIVTEFVNSQTLRDVLDYKRIFSLKESCQIMLQLCDAVSVIHSKNIIHRDIKPHNIYYSTDGVIKLADFGISTVYGEKPVINENKKIIGTVQYLAPEIIYGKKPDFRSDIYSLGITFFELLTGRVPFDSERPEEVASMQIKQKMISPLKFNPSLPKEVELIIFKATDKEPKNRYSSVAHLKKDIENLYNKNGNKRGKGLKNFFGLSE